ncbi:MAG: RhuM family protein, partial [Xanthomonadaceae bacterium]|nr:RhuM family protein [Xanthomonadaceae bacterium]
MTACTLIMRDWEDTLDAFLQFNEREVLTHAGKLRADVAEKLARERYESFDAARRDAARLAAVTDRPIGATHDRLNGATCRLRKTGLERGAVSGVLWGLGNCRFCGLR